eukprot:scaffold6.g2581.t1
MASSRPRLGHVSGARVAAVAVGREAGAAPERPPQEQALSYEGPPGVEDRQDAVDVLAAIGPALAQERQQLWQLRQRWPSYDPTEAGDGRLLGQQCAGSAAGQRQQGEEQQEQQQLEERGWVQPLSAADGSLPPPRVQGLAEEEVVAALLRRLEEGGEAEGAGDCGACPGCTGGGCQGCLAQQALQAWEAQLGPVTATDVAALLLVPTYRQGHTTCGACCACQRAGSMATRQACQTVIALSTGELPRRLMPAAVLGGWLPKQRSAKDVAVAELVQELLRQLGCVRGLAPQAAGGHSGGRTVATASRVGSGDSGGDGLSSEEDERWLPWVRHSLRQQEQVQALVGADGAQQGQQRSPRPQPCARDARCVLRPGHPGACAVVTDSQDLEKLKQAAQALRLPLHELGGPWTCDSRVPHATAAERQQRVPPGKRRRLGLGAAVASGDSQPSQGAGDATATVRCGALNRPPHCFNCGACGAARWSGPLGELHRRVAAAMQQAQGELRVGGLRPAAAAAARIAWEGGTAAGAAGLLPAFTCVEELEHLAQQQQAVARLVLRAQEAAATGQPALRPEEASACRQQRQSQLGRAATALEVASMRLAEEQAALVAVQAMREAIDASLAAVAGPLAQGQRPWWWADEAPALAAGRSTGTTGAGGGQGTPMQPSRSAAGRSAAPPAACAQAGRALGEAAAAAAAALLAEAQEEGAALGRGQGQQAERQQQQLSFSDFARELAPVLLSCGLAEGQSGGQGRSQGGNSGVLCLCESLFTWGSAGGGAGDCPLPLLWGWTPAAVGRLQRLLLLHPELAGAVQDQLPRAGALLAPPQPGEGAASPAELPPLAALLFPPLPAGWEQRGGAAAAAHQPAGASRHRQHSKPKPARHPVAAFLEREGTEAAARRAGTARPGAAASARTAQASGGAAPMAAALPGMEALEVLASSEEEDEQGGWDGGRTATGWERSQEDDGAESGATLDDLVSQISAAGPAATTRRRSRRQQQQWEQQQKEQEQQREQQQRFAAGVAAGEVSKHNGRGEQAQGHQPQGSSEGRSETFAWHGPEKRGGGGGGGGALLPPTQASQHDPLLAPSSAADVNHLRQRLLEQEQQQQRRADVARRLQRLQQRRRTAEQQVRAARQAHASSEGGHGRQPLPPTVAAAAEQQEEREQQRRVAQQQAAFATARWRVGRWSRRCGAKSSSCLVPEHPEGRATGQQQQQQPEAGGQVLHKHRPRRQGTPANGSLGQTSAASEERRAGEGGDGSRGGSEAAPSSRAAPSDASSSSSSDASDTSDSSSSSEGGSGTSSGSGTRSSGTGSGDGSGSSVSTAGTSSPGTSNDSEASPSAEEEEEEQADGSEMAGQQEQQLAWRRRWQAGAPLEQGAENAGGQQAALQQRWPPGPKRRGPLPLDLPGFPAPVAAQPGGGRLPPAVVEELLPDARPPAATAVALGAELPAAAAAAGGGGGTADDAALRRRGELQRSNAFLHDPRLLPLVVHPSLRYCGHCTLCRKRQATGKVERCWTSRAVQAKLKERAAHLPEPKGVPAPIVHRIAVALLQQHPEFRAPPSLTRQQIDAVAAALPAVAATAAAEERRATPQQRAGMISGATRALRLYGPAGLVAVQAMRALGATEQAGRSASRASGVEEEGKSSTGDERGAEEEEEQEDGASGRKRHQSARRSSGRAKQRRSAAQLHGFALVQQPKREFTHAGQTSAFAPLQPQTAPAAGAVQSAGVGALPRPGPPPAPVGAPSGGGGSGASLARLVEELRQLDDRHAAAAFEAALAAGMRVDAVAAALARFQALLGGDYRRPDLQMLAEEAEAQDAEEEAAAAAAEEAPAVRQRRQWCGGAGGRAEGGGGHRP